VLSDQSGTRIHTKCIIIIFIGLLGSIIGLLGRTVWNIIIIIIIIITLFLFFGFKVSLVLVSTLISNNVFNIPLLISVPDAE
jgi:hypothetical protein